MIGRLVIQSVLWNLFMGALLFVPAGTLAWPGAWMLLAELGGMGLALGLWLARSNPGLLAERLRPAVQKEQKRWDQILVAAIGIGFCLWFVLMGLDAKRFGWSHMPLILQSIGALGTPVCMITTWLVFRENSFAAPVVKLQEERGQVAVTTGPYRLVRHPMYAGAIAIFLGVPLLLGSWFGLAMAPLFIAVLGLRAVMEERTLVDELPGYRDYIAKVPYRLVPGIW